MVSRADRTAFAEWWWTVDRFLLVGFIALMVGGVPRFAELLEAFGESCALLLTDQNELLITRGMLDRLELHRQPVLLGRPLELPGDCAGPG